jgi:hypothetical protein
VGKTQATAALDMEQWYCSVEDNIIKQRNEGG